MDSLEDMMNDMHIGQDNDFPTFFARLYPHMILVQKQIGNYLLIPPNQLDWQIEMQQDEEFHRIWYVVGYKQETGDEMSLRYIRSDDGNTWIGRHWYP